MGKPGSAYYKIDIQSLNYKDYEFQFIADSGFFSAFENSTVNNCEMTCDVALRKTETMIEVVLSLNGKVELICDRTLRNFYHPIKTQHHITFKYGESWLELDDELYEIPRGLDQLDMTPYIYEFTVLSIPMRKLHPDIVENEEGETELIYRSNDELEDNYEVDPRWEKLKNLKK